VKGPDTVRQCRRRAAVDLGLEAVEHDNLVAVGDEPAHEVRTDGARAARDERPHRRDDSLCLARGGEQICVNDPVLPALLDRRS
jgi:hypothetical protein